MDGERSCGGGRFPAGAEHCEPQPKENAKEKQKKKKNKRRCHALGDLGDVVADAGRGRRRAQRHRQQQLIFGKLLAQLLFPIKSNIQKK